MFKGEKIYRLIALSVLGLYLLLAAGTARSKRPWSDEGWFASPALNLITKGYMGTSVLETVEPRGQQKGIDKYTYWIMPLDILAQAAWYKITGFGLFQMRMLSTVWGLVAILSWWVIMYTLSGSRNVALLTSSIIALDYTFVNGASFGRMDMMCAALSFAAYAAYLLLHARNLTLAILASQSLVVASGLSHPFGILGLAGLIFLTLYFDRKRIHPRHFLIALIPYVAGSIGWGLYILKSPRLFVSQFVGNATAGVENVGRLDGLLAPWSAFYREITLRYLVAFGMGPHSAGSSPLAVLKIFLLLTYVIGVAGVLFLRPLRIHRGYKVLLVLLEIYFLILTLVDGQKLSWYLVHMIPLFAALLAVFLSWLWTSTRVPRWAIVTPMLLFAALQLGGLLLRIRQDDYRRSYLPAIDFLKRNAGSALIMGSTDLAFQLGFDANLVDDIRLGYYSGKRPDFIVIDEIYENAFAGIETQDMTVYQHMMDLLANEYHPVYDHGHYKIYARNGLAQ
ncbi:MAG TPA: glycosyltransferase family 39 protein [Pyrinomonadaceae bacterium]|jgi:hypothetical protein|nr:glycosyltransferase family 39 protein [Pyrinomonadaceae bacterium]